MSAALPAPPNGRRYPRRSVSSLSRNPLARESDRTEAALAVVLIGIWLLAFPVAAVVGSLAWAASSSAAAQQAKDRTEGTAALLLDAPPIPYSARGTPMTTPSPVEARWTAPDGSHRTGEISASPGLQAGDAVSIWLDRSGAVTDPPVNATGAAGRVVVLAVGGWLACGVALMSVFWTVRWRLDRDRQKAWAAEWERVGPSWTGL